MAASIVGVANVYHTRGWQDKPPAAQHATATGRIGGMKEGDILWTPSAERVAAANVTH